MSFQTASGFPLVYTTSYYALKQRANLKPGETLNYLYCLEKIISKSLTKEGAHVQYEVFKKSTNLSPY